MPVRILCPEERQQLSTIPEVIHNFELVRFFTLSPADWAVIDPFADSSHRLDQAAHICLLRWLGWSLDADIQEQTALFRALSKFAPEDHHVFRTGIQLEIKRD